MTNQSLIPPFWPSRRLWLKFFIGLVYMPLLFILLWLIFIVGLFSASSELARFAIPFILLLCGGPISLGLLLSPAWRGAGAGLLAMTSMIAVWSLVGLLGLQYLLQNIGEALGLAIVSASGIIVLELVVRDIEKLSGLGELAIGILVGSLLSVLYASLFSPYLPRFEISSGYSSLLGFVGWAAQFSLVWLSAFLFSEWLSHKVGWGGGIVWLALILIVFGLSFMLMK